jgi:hypothetical protein
LAVVPAPACVGVQSVVLARMSDAPQRTREYTCWRPGASIPKHIDCPVL